MKNSKLPTPNSRLKAFADSRLLLAFERIWKSRNLLTGLVIGTVALLAVPAQAQQYRVLHSFLRGSADPYAGLIQASDGSFYGMTSIGGANDLGTVFKMDAFGVVTTLHFFTGQPLDGAYPFAGLIQGSDGNFYGTTYGGGASNNGTVFKMDASGAVTTLYSFSGLLDGASLFAGLAQGSDGNFYGTAYYGGPTNNGTVFKMDTLGVVTALHFFAGSDGANPDAGVIQGSDGNFYGTTYYGGPTNNGTLFKMDTVGVVTTLHSFAGSDGANPYAGLIEGSDGNFYGTTTIGGANDLGTVFKMDASGVVTTLHSFAGSDGTNPYGGLIQGSDGNFYGTANQGGGADYGTVFKMDASGVVTTVHSFAGSDGALPYAGLIQGNDGDFYGATLFGGASNNGTVFRINIAPGPVQLLSAVSRKIHGTAGDFDVNLPLNGNPGIECRSGGANGGHTIIFSFVHPLMTVGGTFTGGSGSVASSNIDSNDAHNYIVNLTGVTNAQVMTVGLNDVTDVIDNYSGAVSIQLGVLLGDVNASRRVDAADVSLIRQQTLQPIDSSNFREDINVSGRIDAADVSIARQQTLTSLP